MELSTSILIYMYLHYKLKYKTSTRSQFKKINKYLLNSIVKLIQNFQSDE